MKKTGNQQLINKAGIIVTAVVYSFAMSCSTINTKTEPLKNPIFAQNLSTSRDGLLSPIAQKVFERINDPNFTKESNATIPKDSYLTFGNKFIKPLVDGTQIFPGFKEIISKAEHEVKLVSFEWNDKTDAARVIGEGLKLAEQNIPAGKKLAVKIIIDQVREQGNKVIKALLNSRKNWNLDPNKIDLDLAVHPHTALGAIHTKYLVVDGKSVIITGANVQDVHNFTPDIWHDTGYNIEGPIANSIQKDFEQAWENDSKYLTCTEPESSEQCTDGDPNLHPHAPVKILATPFNDGFPIIALTKSARELFNKDIANPLDQGWLAAMENAQTYINIETPNINAAGFQDAVVAAVKRGILVKIITGKGFNDASENLPTQGGKNSEIVKKLQKQITKEAFDMRGKLQFRWYSKTGNYPVDGNKANASHTKYMSVDGKITIIGSGNMDTQTWKQSREFNFLLDEPSVTNTIENAFFNSDWQRAIQIPY